MPKVVWDKWKYGNTFHFYFVSEAPRLKFFFSSCLSWFWPYFFIEWMVSSQIWYNDFLFRKLVWIAEKTLFDKNQNKVFKLRLWRAGSLVINKICTKWKLNSSHFKRHKICYIQTSMSQEISTLKGEEILTGRVSFLRSKLVCIYQTCRLIF